MADWVYYAVQITNGQIQAELPLTGFSGQRSLRIGGMSASVGMSHLPTARRQEILEYTTPAKYSVLAERNGVVVGEWIIWSRSRSNDNGAISLSGAEFVSFLDRRIQRGATFTNIEQVSIARTMMIAGFSGLAVTIPSFANSGILRDRTYDDLAGTIGERLKELSEVEDGFEYGVDTARAVNRTDVTRTARLYYPKAGIDSPYVFEMGGEPNYPAGNVLSLNLDEDGTKIGSRAFAVGAAVDGDAPVFGLKTGTGLTAAGYPSMEILETYGTVEKQATINSYANRLYADRQSDDEPITLTALADAFPTVGDYGLGDRLAFYLEPSVNFPDGYSGFIRIIGYSYDPSSGPETMGLDIEME